jgi:hypothetical protein
MSRQRCIKHPVSAHLAMWLRSLTPKQREVLVLRVGWFQGYITHAINGEPVASSLGWGLAYYMENPHLLSVWPALA